MKTIERVQHTSYKVAGHKGMGYVWHNHNCLGASVEHKKFLPPGATQDEFNPSYWSIRGPSPAQIERFINTMKAKP